MTRRHVVAAGVTAALLIAGAVYGTFWLLEQPVPQTSAAIPVDGIEDVPVEAPPLEPAEPQDGMVNVRLYVLDRSGASLATEEHEVPRAGSLQQDTRQVIDLLLRRSAAMPRGVELRDVFITAQGVAYVDLSQEFVQNHPGGTSAEELTIYGLSSTLIANFPTIKMVKILVEGREIQSLTGHLDLTIPYGRAPSYLSPDSEQPNGAN